MRKVLIPLLAALSVTIAAPADAAKRYPVDTIVPIKCGDTRADFIYKLDAKLYLWKIAVTNRCPQHWIHVHWVNGKKVVDLLVPPGRVIDLWNKELDPLPTRTAKKSFRATAVTRPCERLSRKADYWMDDEGVTRYNCYL
jgi:hypothetical protein